MWSLTRNALVDQWLTDMPAYAADQLFILDKSNLTARLTLNPIQLDLHARLEAQLARLGRIRVVILKARQVGVSTYLAARMFHRCHLNEAGARCYVLAHDDDTAKKLARMPRTMYDRLKPGARRASRKTNDHELELVHGGLMEYHTAGQGTKGRGGTLSHYHSSEMAFQDHAALHMAASLQQLADRPGTEAYFESTANGPVGPFYEMWRSAVRGETDFMPVFYPWFHQAEYATPAPPGFAPSTEPPNDVVESEHDYQQMHGLTLDQMYWRRRKALELGAAGMDGWLFFAQEYPATADEAFGGTSLGSFISPRHVEAARLRNSILDPLQSQMPLVMGVDPAPQHGGSATAVVWRRGTVCYRIERWRGLSVEQQVLRLYHEATSAGAARICMDTSEGTGKAIFERLCTFAGTAGNCVNVVFGGKPHDRSRYRNMRAEIWSRMSDWLSRQASIPDEAAGAGQSTLATELVSVQQVPNERLVQLEDKAQVVKRIGHSPDGADALATTFFYPDPAPMAYAGTVVAPQGDMLDTYPPSGESFVARFEM